MKKIDARLRKKAVKGMQRTLREASYWREQASLTLGALKKGLPMHRDEWILWSKKA